MSVDRSAGGWRTLVLGNLHGGMVVLKGEKDTEGSEGLVCKGREENLSW